MGRFRADVLLTGLPIAVAFRVWSYSPPTAIVVGVIGLTSVILLARVVRRTSVTEALLETSGELSSESFDYIVWVAIGLPFVVVIAMLGLLVTGALGSSR